MYVRPWAMYLKKKALLQYNSCIMQFIHLKCRVQWFLVYLQLCANITIMMNFIFFLMGRCFLNHQIIYQARGG